MFDFFKRFSEEEILRNYVNPTNSILFIGPFLNEKNDPTLLILANKIRCNNITVIDIQGGDKIFGGLTNPAGEGDLFATRDSLKKFGVTHVKFVFANALNLSFTPDSFDIIIDRQTHEFIISSVPESSYLTSEERMDRMLLEYNKVLKKKGKIIFFSAFKETIRPLVKNLKIWGYKIKIGKVRTESVEIDGIKLTPFRESKFYIIAKKR